MSDSGIPDGDVPVGVPIPASQVQVGDTIRLEYGHGNYVTGEVTHDGTTWWCNGNDINGTAYDPEFNGGKRRVVLLERDGRTLTGAPIEAEWTHPAPPPGTRPEFEVPWMSIGIGDEVRLEFDDDSAVPHVSGVVQDSGDGLCVYTAAGHGYQIDRPNRRVIMLRRAHEVELDRVTGVDKLRAEWAAASNVLLGCLMLGPATPKVPDNPGLMLLAMLIQERIGGLLRGIEDNERAAAVLADNGYASNAPFPLAASVGELMKAAKHLEQQRRDNLGTASDFGLARNVAAEAGFEEETLAGAVRAMANRITELEGAAKQLERDKRMLAHDGQAWESKYGTAVRANEQANQSSVVQRQALEGIRDVLYAALPTAEPDNGYMGFPSWTGQAIAEARRAGREPIAGGPGGLSDRIMDLINNQFPGALNALRDDLHHKIMIEIRRELREIPEEEDRPYSARLADIINRVLPPSPSVSTGERKRLHDAIMAEIYAHPGDRLSRPAAAFLADQLLNDLDQHAVVHKFAESRGALRSAFIETALEFFSDADEGETTWAPESQPERMAADLLRRAAEVIEEDTNLFTNDEWAPRWLAEYREWLGANPGAAATEDDPLKHATDGAAAPKVEAAFAILGEAIRDAGEELLRRWEDITGRKP